MESGRPNKPDPDDARSRPWEEGCYVLRLYVSGSTPNSVRAIRNIRQTCEEHLQGRYHLEVVDIYQQPEMAQEAQIVAAPTLIRNLPPPIRRLVGDLSAVDRVLKGLDLEKVAK